MVFCEIAHGGRGYIWLSSERGSPLLTLDTASRYRHLFPVFDRVTYINSCSQGALAYQVRAALDEYLDGMESEGALWDLWVTKQEEVRGLIARAFGTSESKVAVTPSASAALNSLMSSFDFSRGRKKIVTTSLEFPTLGQIAHAQELRGARVVHISAETDNTLDLAKLEKAIDEDTALVAVTHVCYRNGAMTDIESVVEIGHRHGVPVLVDAYQSGGAMPINFDSLGADFLIGGGHKYLLTTPGLGFLLVNGNSKFIPTTTGWFAARDIFAMDIFNYDPSQDARRFEGGTPPIPTLYASAAGIKLLLDVGISEAWAHTKEVHRQLREGLTALRAQVATPAGDGNHAAMIAVKTKDEHAMVNALNKERVVVSSRDGNLRISPHFYNNHQDVDRILAAIHKHRNLLV